MVLQRDALPLSSRRIVLPKKSVAPRTTLP